MKKNKKLSLKDIEVESFVTSLEENEKETVNGGATLGIFCTVVVTTVIHSVAFGDCVTGGNGLFCEKGQTWAGCNYEPDLPAMSHGGGGGDNCHQYSDNCPRTVGQAGCLA